MIIGSPLYMSPEQLRSTKTVDCRADIWALGGILFQLLTTHTPYDARTVADLCAMLLRDPPTPPSRYRADLPLELEAVILRCLERDPDQRYQNVSALADALVTFGPPSARIHADRARGVLVGPAESVRSPSQYELASRRVADTAPATPAEAVRLSASPRLSAVEAERVPLVATNGKTAASWGTEVQPEQRRRKVVWVTLGVGALLGLVAGGAHFVSAQGQATAPIDSASTVAGAAPAPLESITGPAAPAPVAAPPAAPQPEVRAAATVPPEPGPNSAPRVEPVSADVHPTAAPAAAARPANGLPKAARVVNAEAPAAAPNTGTGLTNFGGRK
jgi:serine/threonine-protein kinase